MSRWWQLADDYEPCELVRAVFFAVAGLHGSVDPAVGPSHAEIRNSAFGAAAGRCWPDLDEARAAPAAARMRAVFDRQTPRSSRGAELDRPGAPHPQESATMGPCPLSMWTSHFAAVRRALGAERWAQHVVDVAWAGWRSAPAAELPPARACNGTPALSILCNSTCAAVSGVYRRGPARWG